MFVNDDTEYLKYSKVYSLYYGLWVNAGLLMYNSKQSGTQTRHNSGASTNNERPDRNLELQYSVWLEEDSNCGKFCSGKFR